MCEFEVAQIPSSRAVNIFKTLQINPSNAEATFGLRTSWYSLDCSCRVLSDEYPYARDSVILQVFPSFCIGQISQKQHKGILYRVWFTFLSCDHEISHAPDCEIYAYVCVSHPSFYHLSSSHLSFFHLSFSSSSFSWKGCEMRLCPLIN